MGCRRWLAGGMLLLAFTAPRGFTAEVSVPLLELLTRGAMAGGRFSLQTEGEIDVLLDSGERLSGRARMGFAAGGAASSLESAALSFESIHLTWAGLFGGSAAFSLFYGERDAFGSGAVFAERFAGPDPDTLYAGFAHFPTGIRYEGIHPFTGTGLQLDYSPRPEHLLFSGYLYQDGQVDGDGAIPTDFETGYYSADARVLLSLPRLRLESFLGVTYPAPGAPLGWYRGGLLFHAAEEGVEFFAQLGMPRWSPSNDPLDIRLLYLLFEPRVRLGRLGIIPTFFWHPAYYRQTATGEQAFDINLNLLIGGWPYPAPGPLPEAAPPGPERRGDPVSGGLETRLSYVMEEESVIMSELRVALSPYLRVQAAGFTWDFRLTARLLPFVLDELVEAFMGLRLEF